MDVRYIGVERCSDRRGGWGRMWGGGWAAPTRKLTPKPSLTTRPLGRAIRRLTVRRPIRLPGPLLLSSLGQIESRGHRRVYTEEKGRYSARKHTEPVFGAEKGPFLWGLPALTCNAHARMVTRLHHNRERRGGGEETGYEEEKEGRRRRLQRSEEASELSGPFRGFAWRETRARAHKHTHTYTGLLSKFCFRFASWFYDDAPLPPPCRRIRAAPSVFRPTFVPFSRILVRLYEGGTVTERNGGIPTSLRRCCCATVRPFHRNRSKLARCPSVCLIEIRTVTVAADKRSLQAMLVKIGFHGLLWILIFPQISIWNWQGFFVTFFCIVRYR